MKRVTGQLLLILLPSLLCAQDYWQQQADYTLEVTLDDRAHTLDGSVKIRYTNHSPDTLTYIWFHLWPNAYKNEQTAFSNQMLQLGNTGPYFSREKDKGYINRLDFKVNGVTAVTDDHPQFIDVVRLLLPTPLPPGRSADISTPFHVKIPAYTSRLGHVGQQYLITQWYPKPAVYDRQGWHPMPYLDQGEFYAEFGHFDVKVRLPADYMVASGGILQNSPVIEPYQAPEKDPSPKKKTPARPVRKINQDTLCTPSSPHMNTWHFTLENAHDFAWFAGKKWTRKEDTLSLPSGKKIHIQVYHQPWVANKWKNALACAKRAIAFYSEYLGDYPYASFSVVACPGDRFTGMEYPGVTLISSESNEALLEQVIAHEAGHNWFQAALGSNERAYPWLDEGLNTWIEQKYLSRYSVIKSNKKGMHLMESFMLDQLLRSRRDLPINTPAEQFSSTTQYALIAYQKTARWLSRVEEELGEDATREAFRKYYEEWKFRHPGPDDFRSSLEKSSGKTLTPLFELLDQKGTLPPSPPAKKKIRVTGFFNQERKDSIQYISLMPAIGYNANDGLMPGLLLHNYQLPLPKLRFLAAPTYGVESRQWNGLATVSYHQYGSGKLKEWSAGVRYATFSTGSYHTGQERLSFRMQQFMPEIRLKLAAKGTSEKNIRFRHYSFREEDLLFQRVITGNDTSYVPGKTTGSRYLNQLMLGVENPRALYPYTAHLVLEQMQDLWKAGFTGTYFFNYAGEKKNAATEKKQGLQARLFAGKILYPGAASLSKRFRNSRYHLNMTGPKGDEDYTYSNYFIGRNDFEGFHSQQIMMRDGGFKVRTDLLSSKTGKTDDWLAALNLVTDVPPGLNPLQVLPVKIPLKLFLDIGTYAEAWEPEAPASQARLLYDAGLQFSIFREAVNIYVPLLYSKVYRDYFNSTLGDKKFWKTISFSIQLDVLQPTRWMPGIGL